MLPPLGSGSRPRRRAWLPVLAMAGTVTACGGDSSGGSPTAPSTSTTAVTVTVRSPLRMGETAQASGTSALSNGQSENVTSGWQTDNAGVATVTGAGLVTGVANGRATIYVVTGGRQGQQVIRVVPDYQGQWRGTLRVTSCTQTGIWADIGLCDDFPVNATEGFDLTLMQTGESMNARMFFGDAGAQTVAAPVNAEGATAFSGTASVSEEGITVSVETAWQLNSPRIGELAGTVSDRIRAAGYSGEGRVTYAIASATRTSTTAGVDSRRDGSRGWRATLQRLDRIRH